MDAKGTGGGSSYRNNGTGGGSSYRNNGLITSSVCTESDQKLRDGMKGGA